MIFSKKARALMLAVIMLFSIIFSSLLIIADSSHDCTLEDCHICQAIQLCLEKFKGFDKDDKDLSLPSLFAVFFTIICFSVISNDKVSTLVNQKVKLSI